MGQDSGVFFSTEILRSRGCRGCVWKETGECPRGFTGVDDTTVEGYCDKLVNFLSNLVGVSGSVDVALEKFQLYVFEVQSVEDKLDMLRLRERLRLAYEDGSDESVVQRLQMQINAYKTWWYRLSESVAKGRGRVNDRESRSKDVVTGGYKLDLSAMHQLVNAEVKRLGEK